MQKLQLVVVGPGLIGLKHLSLIGSSAEAKLHSIVAPAHPDNQLVADSLGVVMHKTIEACLAVGGVDGVIISSPNQFHFEQASACIKAGVPVLVEKPVTVDLDEGRALVELSNRHQAKVLVGHHRTYSPLLTTARNAIAEGRLGRLVSVIGSAQFFKPDQYFVDGPWRTEEGGGPILINMIHEVGNLRTLVGEIRAVQAIASSAVRDFSVEDTVSMNFLFENGVLGTFLLSDTAASPKSWEQTSGENPAFSNYPDEDCYFITGTRGTLSFPSMKLRYFPDGVDHSWLNPLDEEILQTPRADPLQCQFEHFLNVIRGSEEPKVSASEGFRNLLVTEAIKKSAQTGCRVEVAG